MPEDLYTELLSIPAGPRPPNHYAILGLPLFEPDTDVIHEAVLRQTAELKRYVLHPDPDRIRRVQELLNEIHAAGAILQDPRTKAPYDERLALQLRIALPTPELPALRLASEATPAAQGEHVAEPERAPAGPLAQALPAAPKRASATVRASVVSLLSRHRRWVLLAAGLCLAVSLTLAFRRPRPRARTGDGVPPAAPVVSPKPSTRVTAPLPRKPEPLGLRPHVPVSVPPRMPASDNGQKVVFGTGPVQAILQPPDALAGQNQALRIEPDPGNPDAVLVKHRSRSGFGCEILLACKRQSGQVVWDINKENARDYAACLQYLVLVAVARDDRDEVCLPCMRSRKLECRDLVFTYRADGSAASTQREAVWSCRYPWPEALCVQHKDLGGGKPVRLAGRHASSGGSVGISSGTDRAGRFTAVTFTRAVQAPGRAKALEIRLVLRFTVEDGGNTTEGAAVTAALSCEGVGECLEDLKRALPRENGQPQEVFREAEGVMLLDPWGIPLAVLTPTLRVEVAEEPPVPKVVEPPKEFTRPVPNGAPLPEPNVERPRVCPTCGGKVVIPCPACEGKGVLRTERELCGACYGRGRRTCAHCQATGSVQGRCSRCGGDGTYTDTSTGRKRKVRCGACGGDGKRSVTCSDCKGAGSWKCQACDGNGVVTRQLKCGKCGGQGTIRCPDCGR